MAAAEGTVLEAYTVLSLLSGVRTEEARALRWDHVVAWVDRQWQPVSEAGFDHEPVAVFVWRADRAGGDTKTRNWASTSTPLSRKDFHSPFP
jgi:integrase